jgi:molybdate transport system permease protein
MLTELEWQALLLSARVASWATLGCLIPGIFFGWLLARRKFFGKSIVEAMVYLPMVLPPVVPGYLLLVLFGEQGFLGKWFRENLGWHVAFTWKGAALASAVIAFPLMVQAVRLSIKLIDLRLENAARTLGASAWRVFFTITLPLSLPGLLAGSIMTFSRALGEFGATITFVGNIPGETRTLPLAIYSAMHQIDGDTHVVRLIIICIALTFTSLLISNAISRRSEKWLGAHHD